MMVLVAKEGTLQSIVVYDQIGCCAQPQLPARGDECVRK